MSRLLLLLAVAAWATAAPLPFHNMPRGHDWPQFRGPARDNLSTDRKLLRAWPAAGPPLAWKSEGVGSGFASVIVSAGKVLTMGDRGGETFVVALSQATGKQEWSARIGKAGKAGSHAGARSTPATDGRRVFALGEKGDLVCLDFKTGKELWRKDLVEDFGGKPGTWGYAESPLLDGDRLVVTPGGEKATVVALDKDGKEAWRSAAGMPAGYASLVPFRSGNTRLYAQLTADGALGVSAEDGAVLWKHGKLKGISNACSPVAVPGHVFVSAGMKGGGSLLALGKKEMKEAWHRAELKNRFGGVLATGDLLFGDTDMEGRPFCAEWKTGKAKWVRAKGSSRGAGSATMTWADGHLYVLYENGHLALVPATAEGYREAASLQLDNSKRTSRAVPVVVGGKLYVREQDVVRCYDVAAK
ncbi:MAG: PQQ-binding-like beta-propeller repeat protein [Gemmataceae bacterium]|nr:PQQ-binding-like beta-propeller repeat protein [Gemmataceae bacterium]